MNRHRGDGDFHIPFFLAAVRTSLVTSRLLLFFPSLSLSLSIFPPSLSVCSSFCFSFERDRHVAGCPGGGRGDRKKRRQKDGIGVRGSRTEQKSGRSFMIWTSRACSPIEQVVVLYSRLRTGGAWHALAMYIDLPLHVLTAVRST